MKIYSVSFVCFWWVISVCGNLDSPNVFLTFFSFYQSIYSYLFFTYYSSQVIEVVHARVLKLLLSHDLPCMLRELIHLNQPSELMRE